MNLAITGASGHIGGSEALTFVDIAAVLTDITGKPLMKPMPAANATTPKRPPGKSKRGYPPTPRSRAANSPLFQTTCRNYWVAHHAVLPKS